MKERGSCISVLSGSGSITCAIPPPLHTHKTNSFQGKIGLTTTIFFLKPGSRFEPGSHAYNPICRLSCRYFRREVYRAKLGYHFAFAPAVSQRSKSSEVVGQVGQHRIQRKAIKPQSDQKKQGRALTSSSTADIVGR